VAATQSPLPSPLAAAQAHCQMSDKATQRLLRAAQRGNAVAIEQALAEGADPNANEGLDDLPPLHWAAFCGNTAAIAVLLVAGARVAGTDEGGSTALMSAAIRNRPGAIDALVAAGADVNARHRRGHTALHIASSSGHMAAVSSLLLAGARMDVCDEMGHSPVDVVRSKVAVASLGPVHTVVLPHAGVQRGPRWAQAAGRRAS
jgi:ankyrin repeat protein